MHPNPSAGRAPADLGYWFDPPGPPARPAYRRLSVWLRAQPTKRHYDPESVQCPIVSRQHDSETLIVSHPWPAAQSYQLSAGRVVLTDRVGKKVEAFCFGGELQVASDDALTTCVYQSPVPIFDLLELDTVSSRFITAVEMALARCRAEWDTRHRREDFDQRLAILPPLALYSAGLVAVEAQLRSGHPPDESAQGLMRFVEQERHRLQAEGLWPAQAAPLDVLLRGV